MKALSPAEQRQPRAWLDMVLAQAPMTEDAFAHHLVDIGILSEMEPPLTDLTPYQHGSRTTAAGVVTACAKGLSGQRRCSQ